MARITKNHADQIIKSGAFKNIQSYDDLYQNKKYNTIERTDIEKQLKVIFLRCL